MRRYVLRGNRRLAFGDVFHRGGRFVVRNIKANMLFSTLWWWLVGVEMYMWISCWGTRLEIANELDDCLFKLKADKWEWLNYWVRDFSVVIKSWGENQ